MDFNENKNKTLAEIYNKYPDAVSADLGALREDIGFWVILEDGSEIFFKLIEPVKFAPPDGGLFWVFSE